ncbi:MAG: ornithine cyclodeaminase family protein [Hyphomicrobiales bacterium]|nr:ornithine cyclodeaminase family protein [Hyphomicrobiales bacterium]
MRVITAAQIDRVLTFDSLIDALGVAFRGGIIAPVRHHHHIARPDADATLLLMPAWTDSATSPTFVGTKIVTVFPGNAARSLPSIHGLYVLLDGTTGAPLAAMDGARLTLWRTAAASALASRAMARPTASRMLMVGAGALAGFLVRAHASVRPLAAIEVWNRSAGGAERVVAALAASGLPASVSHDLERSAREADIIACATLATSPLIKGEWLRPGAHLDLVGAFNMSMREADDEALKRGRVVVDTPAALSEGGDVAVAIKAGTYDGKAVLGTLFELCAGTIAPRLSDSDITVFKSVGAALEDLSAAILVYGTCGE